MKIRIELTQVDVAKLVHREIEERTGQTIKPERISVQVKSKQNYRAEWEDAEFRAVYESQS